MTADKSLDRLFHLLEDWRKLTLVETELITKQAWGELESIYTEKSRLQEAIQKSEQEVFGGGKGLSSERRAAAKQRLKKLAGELKELEVQNRELLMKRLEETDHQLNALNRNITELQKLQKAYGTAGGSFWQAYS